MKNLEDPWVFMKKNFNSIEIHQLVKLLNFNFFFYFLNNNLKFLTLKTTFFFKPL